MSRFRYQAIDTDGNEVDGEISRDTLADAIAHLESDGKTIRSIERIPSETPSPNSDVNDPILAPVRLSQHGTSNRLRSYFDSVFARRDELIPALDALLTEIPRGSTQRDLRRLVEALRVARSGTELSSNKRATRWLPLLLTGLADGSATHRLGELLATTARESRNRNERRRAILYPSFVFSITLAVFLLVCAVIVPSFRTMFEEFGLTLPTPTLIVVEVSRRFSEQLVPTLATIACAVLAIIVVSRLWIKACLTTRIFGRFLAGNATNVSAMASLTGQLADLLSIGMSLPDALWLAGEGCNHDFFQKAAQELARHSYDSGQPLSACYAADRVPGNVIHALSAGPDGAPHLPLLYELAAIYSDHAMHRTGWITGAAAQLSVILLGLAVGFVVIALFAPLVTLVSGLS